MSTTNSNVQKEAVQHGLSSYPCAVYDNVLHPDYRTIPLHWHPELEINLVTSGHAELILNFHSYTAQTGDIILVNKEEVHGFFQQGKEPFTSTSIVLHPDFLDSRLTDDIAMDYLAPIKNHTLLLPSFLKKECPEDAVYQAVYEKLCRIFDCNHKKNKGYQLLTRALLLEILYDLIPLSTAHKAPLISRRSESIKKVLDFIEQNSTRQIRAEEAAKISGYSKYHFIRIFKEATGQDFSQYINQIRLEHAVTLLKDTSLPVTEVALSAGFSDAAYFSRKFRETYHTTPSAFRKRFK